MGGINLVAVIGLIWSATWFLIHLAEGKYPWAAFQLAFSGLFVYLIVRSLEK